MNTIETFCLAIELKRRISDHLYDPEPQHDEFLEALWVENESNELLMGSVHNQLAELIRKYEMIVRARMDDRDYE